MTLVIDVVDVNGSVITTLANAVCQTITRTKNAPDEAVIIFPKYAYTRDDVHIFADDSGAGDLHEIRVMRDSSVRFWGPAISADLTSHEGMVTLHCRGVDWYLWRRYINGQRTNALANPSFETGDESAWSPVGAVTHSVINTDSVRGTYSLRLVSSTTHGDIFETQTVTVTGTGVGAFMTISGYFKLEGSIASHALDRRGLYVEATVSGVVQTNNFAPIDEATPTGVWTRIKTSIQVPPLTTWDLNIRLYAPDGSILWDDLQVVAMQSVSTAGLTGNTYTPVDIADIVQLVLSFVQDPTFGHSDVNIGFDYTPVGISQVKHIQWASEIKWSDQMAEWFNRGDCFDYSIVYTETTRTLTLHVPQQGVDRRSGGGAVTLTFPSANVASYTLNEDGSGTITDDTEMDQDTGDGPDREEGHYADPSQIGGLTLQAVNAVPSGETISSLDPLAQEQVNKARRPALLYTFKVTDQDGTEYDELLGLGDLVNFGVIDGWSSGSGYGAIGQTVEYPPNRVVDVTLAKAI